MRPQAKLKIMNKATEIYVETYRYYRSKGYPEEDARDIAAMSMVHYLDLEEGEI